MLIAYLLISYQKIYMTWFYYFRYVIGVLYIISIAGFVLIALL